MRRFGSNKKNPNPPWPNEQSVVIVPPGSNSTAIGLNEQQNGDVRRVDMSSRNTMNVSEKSDLSEREIRRDPIMGNMLRPPQRQSLGYSQGAGGGTCGNISVTNYLCGQIGKYVKLEFLFGENTHMEKLGRLKGVGKDFVAIQENGTGNTIVCATGKIKFINIYEYGQ